MIGKNLLSKRGETIMETIVSLVIMGLLITSLLAIIRFSLVLTGDALSNASVSQSGFNDLIHNVNYSGDPTTLTFTIHTLVPSDTSTAIQVVNMSLNTDDFPGAFRPVP